MTRVLPQEPAEHHTLPDFRAAPQDFDFFAEKPSLFSGIQQQKVLAVEPDSLSDVPHFSPSVVGWNVAPVHGVKQSEESDFFPLCLQLLRHLVGDRTTHAVSAQVIRPVRLDAANLVDIKRCHLLYRL